MLANFGIAPHLDVGCVDIDGFGGFDSFDWETSFLVGFLGRRGLDILGITSDVYHVTGLFWFPVFRVLF